MSKLPFTVTALVPVLLISQLQQDTKEPID